MDSILWESPPGREQVEESFFIQDIFSDTEQQSFSDTLSSTQSEGRDLCGEPITVDRFATALKTGEHQIVRRFLRDRGKSTRLADIRYADWLRSLFNKDLSGTNLRRIRTGLTHIVSEWSLTAESRRKIVVLHSYVCALECWDTSLREHALYVLRNRVDHLIDQILPDCLEGTHLGTMMQFTIRALRDPDRRALARPKFYKLIKLVKRRILNSVPSWALEFADEPAQNTQCCQDVK